MATRPQLIGLPYDASSSFLRGSAAAPPVIRHALWSPAGNRYTENGADLAGLTDAGDLALPDDRRWPASRSKWALARSWPAASSRLPWAAITR